VAIDVGTGVDAHIGQVGAELGFGRRPHRARKVAATAHSLVDAAEAGRHEGREQVGLVLGRVTRCPDAKSLDGARHGSVAGLALQAVGGARPVDAGGALRGFRWCLGSSQHPSIQGLRPITPSQAIATARLTL